MRRLTILNFNLRNSNYVSRYSISALLRLQRTFLLGNQFIFDTTEITVLRSNSQYLVIIIIVWSSAFFVQHTALFILLWRSSFLSTFDNSSNQSSNNTRNNQCTNEYQKLITNFNHFSRSRSSLEFLKHLAIHQSDLFSAPPPTSTSRTYRHIETLISEQAASKTKGL